MAVQNPSKARRRNDPAGAQPSRAESARRTGKMSVREVAEYLGVSEKTVWRWHEAGEMPKAKKLPGRSVRWDRAAIEKWWNRLPDAD